MQAQSDLLNENEHRTGSVTWIVVNSDCLPASACMFKCFNHLKYRDYYIYNINIKIFEFGAWIFQSV
jgi:hypothetical protein